MNKKELIIFFTILAIFMIAIISIFVYQKTHYVELAGTKIPKTVYNELREQQGDNGVLKLCNENGCYYFKPTGYDSETERFQGPVPQDCDEMFFRENGYCE